MTLCLIPQSDQALTPDQLRFNELVKKVDQARASLLEWEQQMPAFTQAHVQATAQLRDELFALRLQLSHKLDRLLSRKSWSMTEREDLSALLCHLIETILASPQCSPAISEAQEALLDKHAGEGGVDFDDPDVLAELKAMTEASTGLDLGDEAFDSPEAIMQKLHEAMAAQAAAQAEAQQAKRDQREQKRSAKKPTVAQLARLQEQEAASMTLREVYRKLASALHPDRSTDPTDHQRRTDLMQRVNRAYEAQDILALFALQLEIEQIDPEHLAKLTAERARHYNRILSTQLQELKAELQERRRHFLISHDLNPHMRVVSSQLGAVLQSCVRSLESQCIVARRDLRQLDDMPSARRWLRHMKVFMSFDDMPAY